MTRHWLAWPALGVAALLAAPILTLIASLFQTSDSGTNAHLFATVLPGYVGNTALLAVLVAIGVGIIGTGTAWLVTMCRFPGRDVLAWALILPLACPAYVIAYAYTDFLQHAGPVQSALRAITGWGPRAYWFPQIRSLEGAAAMFTLVLYPYVYLLARAAFISQSASAFEAARTLGRGALGAFMAAALPLARPAIATGIMLAVMETLADFGTVAHFGVRTFTTGIYTAWVSMGDRVAAAQLATGLLAMVALIVALERLQRGGARFDARSGSVAVPFDLGRGRRWLASAACAIPVILGFLLPTVILVELAIAEGESPFSPRYVSLASTTASLGAGTAVLATGLAMMLAYAARLSPGPVTLTANRLIGLGYAVPGSILAVAILVPVAWADTNIDAFMRANLGVSTGLLIGGSVAAMIYAYLIRFMTVALHSVEAGLSQVTPTMDDAARSLGAGATRTLWRIHMPLLRPAMLSAALLVFVDVMKELPATLMMRPFNIDTLAVRAYQLAADERLAQAATPSLMIVGVGLLPVLLLSRDMKRKSPGRQASTGANRDGAEPAYL